ncbi:MAG: class I adenylate-forming enzyme family protein [Myxococcota bacterium]
MDADALYQQVYGPGAPFEIAHEPVLGETLPVFKNRPRSLRDLLERSRAHSDTDYIVFEDQRITYAEHVELVARVARRLRDDYAIGPGDRVAILAANCPEWILCFWAVTSLGGVVAALNGWWTEDEIRYGLELSEPKLLIGDQRRLARLEGRDPGVPVAVIEEEVTAWRNDPPTPLPDAPIDEDDAALLLFTSGTTGRPKAALISHRGLIGFVQVVQSGGMLQFLTNPPAGGPKPTRALLTVPLFHVSGLFAGTILFLASGATTVWRAGRFEEVAVLELLEREKITSWAGLGSMGPRVLNHPDIGNYDLSSLTNLGGGGAPLTPSYIQRVKQVASNGPGALAIGYGSSETVSTAASHSGEELDAHPDSTGRVVATVSVEIRDEQDRPLPDGREGEIHVRSAYLMREYWRNPEATAKVLKPGRWLATGDIGHLREGRLYINSRARDMILRAAENIYPIEIESRIDLHPKVSECAVIGVDHPELGQEVKAVVVPTAGTEVDFDELSKWCAETLAPFKVPSCWELRPEPLPRNAAGKILKNALEDGAPTPPTGE